MAFGCAAVRAAADAILILILIKVLIRRGERAVDAVSITTLGLDAQSVMEVLRKHFLTSSESLEGCTGPTRRQTGRIVERNQAAAMGGGAAAARLAEAAGAGTRCLTAAAAFVGGSRSRSRSRSRVSTREEARAWSLESPTSAWARPGVLQTHNHELRRRGFVCVLGAVALEQLVVAAAAQCDGARSPRGGCNL
ncbi:hypothetical protein CAUPRSCDRAFT_12337 [Caulochytrium protostelioides]|uniref:Uncharacterized protein n=1 Tax=Caulochytrium protostelioides TaxID=1555241 RepID=A0A4P9WRV2_9FUNG|nr:hypothetical protein CAUPRSCDRAFT_12337 [Caulochytrium protostelioides]